MAKEKRHLMMVQEMKRNKITEVSRDWLQGKGNNQHRHGRRPSLVLRRTRLMTCCKMGVNLGCTRSERSNMIDMFYITLTNYYSFFITFSLKIKAKSCKTDFLINFDNY